MTWTDAELLNYIEAHSHTERALFARWMLVKLLELAEAGDSQYHLPEGSFVACHNDVAQPLVNRARDIIDTKAGYL